MQRRDFTLTVLEVPAGTGHCFGKKIKQVLSFTLIELLVVIAIIAVLSAMLLSALSSARERALTSGCMNNLHNLGLAFASYTDEYSCTPPVWANGRWFNNIAPYINSDINMDSGSVWRCPADRQKNPVLSYGINQTVCRNPDFRQKADKLWYGLAVNRIQNPAGFIVLADSCQYYIGKDADGRGEVVELDGEKVLLNGVYSYLALRHADGYCAAFGDGHVEYITYLNMPTEYWDYNGDAYEDNL